MADEELGYDGQVASGPDSPSVDMLWSDAESEEIVSVPKTCAYDPLTRL
ncbi:hypothetical protein [Frankia sp. EAN1pec]